MRLKILNSLCNLMSELKPESLVINFKHLCEYQLCKALCFIYWPYKNENNVPCCLKSHFKSMQ